MWTESTTGRGERVAAARAPRSQPLAAVGAVLPVLRYLCLTSLALAEELPEHLQGVAISFLVRWRAALTRPARLGLFRWLSHCSSRCTFIISRVRRGKERPPDRGGRRPPRGRE